ncbi:glycosyl hydrolase, partial [Sphingomonas aerolata]
MTYELTRRTVLAGMGIGMVGTTLPVFARQPDDSVFLLSYFTDKDEGRDGLKLARSDDGYVFAALGGGRGFLKPDVGQDRLMRDPHLSQGPDGLWHLVWTSDWFGAVIGHATSRDLVRWSRQQTIPVMTAFHGVRNSWAPEMTYDATAREFVIMWS